uniref:C3H1-type domain-containing protein n=1 Tax=Panagrolaimus sp. ES5 TaxID=591445 RepID=A0AC34FBL1_9BILA
MFDDKVPVIEVNRNNYERYLPLLKSSIKHADIIALDLELSGIGNHYGLKGKPFQERYERIVETVKTRSILSIGISIFNLYKCIEEKKTIKLKNISFNLMTMSSDNYVVEPDALAFLSKHGFDFNRLINSAILYSIKSRTGLLTILLKDILSSGASIIFHNGFVDLAFLYHHLFNQIPETIGVFQSSIYDWFTDEGINSDKFFGGRGLFYDSKFAAASDQYFATFLEYVFRKSQRSNVLEYRDSRLYVRVKFSKDYGSAEIDADDIDYVDCSMSPHFLKNNFAINKESIDSLCPFYAQSGFCRKNDCEKVHEVDLMLDIECQKSLKKRRRTTSNNSASGAPMKKKSRGLPKAVTRKLESSDTETGEEESELGFHEKTHFSTKGCHRAGMDAFMTGFYVIFSQRMHLFKYQTLDPAFSNQTLVPGLEKPLPLVNSSYAPSSEKHREIWAECQQKKIKNLKFKSGIKFI